MAAKETLATLLGSIVKHDTDNYDLRYRLVFAAVGQAIYCGYPAGVRLDPEQPEWPVFYIELPTGQVSWHMPQHPITWDGHDTEEKLRRCRAYAESLP